LNLHHHVAGFDGDRSVQLQSRAVNCCVSDYLRTVGVTFIQGQIFSSLQLAVCLPLLIFPNTIKSRSSLLALANPGVSEKGP